MAVLKGAKASLALDELGEVGHNPTIDTFRIDSVKNFCKDQERAIGRNGSK